MLLYFMLRQYMKVPKNKILCVRKIDEGKEKAKEKGERETERETVKNRNDTETEGEKKGCVCIYICTLVRSFNVRIHLL